MVSLASESASLGVAMFVTRHSVSKMQQCRHGVQLLWCLVLLHENVAHRARLCVDGCALPGKTSYTSPKIAGKVKNLSSSIQIEISCFSGADLCSSIYFTVMLLFYGSHLFFLLTGHLEPSMHLFQQ